MNASFPQLKQSPNSMLTEVLGTFKETPFNSQIVLDETYKSPHFTSLIFILITIETILLGRPKRNQSSDNGNSRKIQWSKFWHYQFYILKHPENEDTRNMFGDAENRFGFGWASLSMSLNNWDKFIDQISARFDLSKYEINTILEWLFYFQ